MRLIDADVLTSKLKTTFCEECNNGIRCVACAISDVLFDIKDSPTVDTEKHGHWKPMKVSGSGFCIERPYCSLCGGEGSACYTYKFCPYCGAKMDEVSE